MFKTHCSSWRWNIQHFQHHFVPAFMSSMRLSQFSHHGGLEDLRLFPQPFPRSNKIRNVCPPPLYSFSSLFRFFPLFPHSCTLHHDNLFINLKGSWGRWGPKCPYIYIYIYIYNNIYMHSYICFKDDVKVYVWKKTSNQPGSNVL